MVEQVLLIAYYLLMVFLNGGLDADDVVPVVAVRMVMIILAVTLLDGIIIQVEQI